MEATLGTELHRLLGADWKTTPTWPPDLFGACLYVVRATGTYHRVVGLAGTGVIDLEKWPEEARLLGARWRSRYSTGKPKNAVPREVRRWWADVVRSASERQTELGVPTVTLLLRLAVVADEACRGIGIDTFDPAKPDRLIWDGQARLWTSRPQRTSVSRIDTALVRVLPKRHTPQRGLTLRSLSHHLALVPDHEVTARWQVASDDRVPNRDLLNLLVAPWPLEVERSAFASVQANAAGVPRMSSPHRFFTFRRASDVKGVGSYLEAMLERARGQSEHLHAVIFPELALNWDEYEAVATILQIWCNDKDAPLVLIAGLALTDHASERPTRDELEYVDSANVAVVHAFRPVTGRVQSTRTFQKKHHRWCLDWRQILQYRLEARLPASLDSWERTDIGPRRIDFWALDRWLTFTTLICEDLARQDPVGSVVRAIGPNLVIALLFDGPQLPSRWGAKYASVLADDPGSSVLTVTSLGASLLSRLPGADDRSRVIGLWRDVRGSQEISLGEADGAVLLSVVQESHREWSADGREDQGAAHFPVLASWRPLAR